MLQAEYPFEPEMIPLPGGTFWMGSPQDDPLQPDWKGPHHQVSISPFEIGKYAVTFDEYDRFASETGRELPNDNGRGRGKRPVIYVSWEDAVAYAAWLSEQTAKGYRLPTEAEWEYAARAGTTTPFWTGDSIHTDQANYDGYDGDVDDSGVYRERTVEVGSLPANPWGLHEVHGNVWEWVQDLWHEDYRDAPVDGSAWETRETGEFSITYDDKGWPVLHGARVIRGGSWKSTSFYLQSASRKSTFPEDRSSTVGFRLARTLTSGASRYT